MNMKYAPPHKIKMNICIFAISSSLFILFSLSELLFNELQINIPSATDSILRYLNKDLDIIMIISFVLNNQLVIFLLIVIVYNFFNIYKTFMLLTVLSMAHYFSSLLKLAYMSSRPYFIWTELKPYRCELGFGFPSTQVFSMVSFYLGLWRVIFESKTKDQLKTKYIALVIIILYFTISSVTMLINATHYWTQILSSYFLGICLYFLVFEVFNIDLNSGKEFFYIITFKLVYYSVIFITLAAIPFGLYFLPINQESPFYRQVGCKGRLDYTLFDYSYEVLDKYTEDSLLPLGYFLGNIFAIVGVRLELIYMFNSNFGNWIQFNFSSYEHDSKIDDNSSLSCISITKITKWNNTNTKKSCVRLLIILIIVIICFSPYFAIYDNRSNIYLKFFVKMFLPISLCILCLFYLSKVILRKTDLINTTLFPMITWNLKDSLVK